jgi:hypothetical protein
MGIQYRGSAVSGFIRPNGETPHSGYTFILYSAERLQDMSSEYQISTSPQSGITVEFTTGIDTDITNSNDIWIVIGRRNPSCLVAIVNITVTPYNNAEYTDQI